MSNFKPKVDSATSEDRKALVFEVRRLQKQVQQLKARNQQQKEKVVQHQRHELALMQTNRMLVEMVKSYADREAVIMANWKTLQQSFGHASDPEVVDLDAE